MTNYETPLVALECKLSPGAFSGERVFKVKLANGETYTSLAPRDFCWNDNNEPVKENEPKPKTEIDGMIAARIIKTIDNEQIIVEVPDGQVIAVDHKIVKDRPTVIRPQKYVSI